MIQVASLSIQGRRSSNQDRVFSIKYDTPEESVAAVVADGLGGMQAGDKAAQIAVDTFEEGAGAILENMRGDFRQACRYLEGICQTANDRIDAWAEAHASPGTVGTTLVALFVSGSRYLVVNIGDSRCHRLEGNTVQQMTQDHTVADSLLKQGAISAADYESSPLRNQLVRSLGPKPIAEPDFFPNDAFGTVAPGMAFVLSSDGFYAKLKETDFLKLQNRSSDLETVLKALAEDALARNSTDNISAVVVRFA